MFDAAPRREPPAVLLIDDDMVSREVTATLLTMNGCPVHAAENGHAALALLAAGTCRPGIILMDAQMPGLSGAELIHELRTACRGARVCIISASEPASDLSAAADSLLLKPFDSETLRKLLDGHVRPPRLNPDDPVVKAEVLAQFRQLMPESKVREIYSAAVADLFRRIEALSSAIARSDLDEIHRIGHAIKGGCGMAGAMQAARLGELLENCTGVEQDNHLDNSRVLLADLRAAAKALQDMLDA